MLRWQDFRLLQSTTEVEHNFEECNQVVFLSRSCLVTLTSLLGMRVPTKSSLAKLLECSGCILRLSDGCEANFFLASYSISIENNSVYHVLKS